MPPGSRAIRSGRPNGPELCSSRPHLSRAVAPGATATPGNAAAADALAEMTRGPVAGTPVRPVDIAFAVRFLVSNEASYAHGAVLDIDGGIANVRLG
ncbi:SDR family oxidoreductase [Frigoribacterium sp. 2-23]|uniref:SDR family oxidoreductase n=1 Tax=Frigoribacterium sp. 2-23 TaxID=3415006 RepID=UPI003C6F58DD